MINIGQAIKEEMERQERSVSWLARKLGCQRVSVYRMLSKNSIDTLLLERVSTILGRNFFDDLSSETNSKLKR